MNTTEIVSNENQSTLFKGRNVFIGYYNNQELTESSFADVK